MIKEEIKEALTLISLVFRELKQLMWILSVAIGLKDQAKHTVFTYCSWKNVCNLNK